MADTEVGEQRGKPVRMGVYVQALSVMTAFHSAGAAYAGEGGTAVTGPDAIAALVEEAAGSGITRQLSEPFVALGNFAVMAIRRNGW